MSRASSLAGKRGGVYGATRLMAITEGLDHGAEFFL
jgi:hypothetical protein